MELAAVDLEYCLNPEDGIGYGLGLRLVTMKWRYFSLTVLEFGHGITGAGVYTYAGSRPGFPLYFGENRRHQLRFGLGFDFAVTFGEMSGESTEGAGLFISPSVHYVYQTSGSLFFGAGVSSLLFATGKRNGYPYLILASVGFGFSTW